MQSSLAAIPASTSKPVFCLTPTSLKEAMEFAGLLSKSNLVPKDYQGNPSNCIIAMQWGMEIGLQPLQAMQSIAVINGRPSIWGDAMLALVQGSGLLEYIQEDPTDTGCTCRLKRRGQPNEVVRQFTLEDAKKAGLSGKQGPWTQYPKRMMQMRARAFALRDVFPDVLRGVHIAEEAQDLPAEKDMGMADRVAPDTVALAAPQTRAEKARAAVASRKAAAEPPHATLAQVLDAIAAAGSPKDLAAAAALAAGLEADSDKDDAREAYAQRKRDLAAPPVEVVATDAAAPTYAEVADRLQHAGTRDELDEACSMIGAIAQADQREELAELYNTITAKLTPKAAEEKF
jgi:hypothetical protein